MPTSSIQQILDDAIKLKRDAHGNPRYFIPAAHMPVGPGAQAATDVGLFKYRGFNLGPGFVIQSYDLERDIISVLRALGVKIPK